MEKVVIVGSGPAGYTAAIYCARAGLKPTVLAGIVEAGGALMNTTEVENYPGFPDGILGPDLMEKLEVQAERFGANSIFDNAVKFDFSGDVKKIETEDGLSLEAETVILALGSEYNKLGAVGEEELSGKGVSYCATCDGFFFKDKEIAVIGGGDSALTEALFLTRFGSTVHVIHRRDEFRASHIMSEKVKNHPLIKIHWNTVVDSFNGEESLETITVRDTLTDEVRDIDISGAFISIGHSPRTPILEGQVELDDKGYILVDGRSSKTSVAGVFACGDVVDSTYQQAITAAGSGCVAALDAEHYLMDRES